MEETNYAQVILNNEITLNVLQCNMYIDENKTVMLGLIGASDPIAVFVAMQKYASTINPESGDLITSIKVIDKEGTTIFHDTTHSFTYDAATVSFVDDLKLNYNEEDDEAENRRIGLPQINLRLKV